MSECPDRMNRTDEQNPIAQEPGDDQLMARIREEGSEAAFDALLARHLPSLVGLLARMVGEDAARDLAQEVFLRLWTRSHQWDGHGSVRAWLFRMATNAGLNHLRSLRRRREEPLAPEAPEADADYPSWVIDAASLGPERAAEWSDSFDRLRRLVDRLPEEKRDVMRLVTESGLEPREIAAELGIPEGTVRSRLYYARRRLVRQWQKEEQE